MLRTMDPDDPRLRHAGIRTRLVSRLTGLTPDRLRYWHRSELLQAHQREGSRGIPRLYSWVDYMKLRIAADLASGKVPTPVIRDAVAFLDRHYPEWYLLPAEARPLGRHVLARRGDEAWFIADSAGQFVLAWPDELAAIADKAQQSLDGMVGRGGALGLLREYSDAVVMDPSLNSAKPTLAGSALETAFVAGMAEDLGGVDEVARLYRLDGELVRRAIAFEEAVA